MVKVKYKVLLLLNNCTARHMKAHLSAVEVFLPANTTAKLLPMDQRVLHQGDRTADSNADLNVLLVKMILFASGAWRDVKPQIILNCFKLPASRGVVDAYRRGRNHSRCHCSR